MSTVWILGAGASRADNSQMPLVSDFMPIADRVGWFAGDEGARFLDILARDFGFTEQEIRNSVNIEELLTLTACAAAWHDLQPRTELSLARGVGALAALSSLTYLIADVLIQVQRPSVQSAASLHDALVREMQHGDIVLSYNYDLIADAALLKAGKSTLGNYRIRFDKRIARGRGTADGELSSDPSIEAPGGIDILKLHGSLNWFHLAHENLKSSSEFRFSEHPLFLYHATSAPEWRFVDLPPQFMVRRRAHEPGRANAVAFSPVIVPPTLDKADVWRSGGGVLRELWERAKTALEQSKRVVLIGHSLAVADYQSRWLLRTALATRPSAREVAIVNISPEDRNRLRRFFQSLGTVKLYETVQDLLAARTVV